MKKVMYRNYVGDLCMHQLTSSFPWQFDLFVNYLENSVKGKGLKKREIILPLSIIIDM